MQDLVKYDDDFLVKLYLKEKSKSAIEVLFYRHKDKLLQSILFWGLAYDEAEDLVQDTFFKVLESLNQQKYQCENRFFGWMLRIAKNLMIDRKRREKRGREIMETSFEPTFFGYETGPEEQSFITKEHEEQLLQIALKHMDQLPYNQKEIITLRIFHELSFKEIAAKLDISINTALGRMRYSIINLRKLWEKDEIGSVTRR